MMASQSIPTYTILEADGQHSDGLLEEQIFNETPTHPYQVHFVRTALAPSGTAIVRPWTEVPKELRDQVDGLMILKLYLQEEDMNLFPKLKVPYCPVDHPLIARSRGATLGILGLGRIGTAVALRAKAFGWHVLFYDPYLPNGVDKAVGCERTKNIKELFRRSNILSIHCPSTRETRNSVNYDLLSLLPKNAVLINTARGEIVDLDAVERCLKEDIIVGAGLDVLPVEPIQEPAHSLIQAYRNKEPWLTGRMALTCHTAFFSPSSIEEIRSKSAQTMREVLIDNIQSNVITPGME